MQQNIPLEWSIIYHSVYILLEPTAHKSHRTHTYTTLIYSLVGGWMPANENYTLYTYERQAIRADTLYEFILIIICVRLCLLWLLWAIVHVILFHILQKTRCDPSLVVWCSNHELSLLFCFVFLFFFFRFLSNYVYFVWGFLCSVENKKKKKGERARLTTFNCQITCGVCVSIFTLKFHVFRFPPHALRPITNVCTRCVLCIIIIWMYAAVYCCHHTAANSAKGRTNAINSRSLVFQSMNWSEFVARIPSSQMTRCTIKMK